MSLFTNLGADDLRSLGAILAGAVLTIGHQLRLGHSVKQVKDLAEPTGNGWAKRTTETLEAINTNVENLTGRVSHLETVVSATSADADTSGPPLCDICDRSAGADHRDMPHPFTRGTLR